MMDCGSDAVVDAGVENRWPRQPGMEFSLPSIRETGWVARIKVERVEINGAGPSRAVVFGDAKAEFRGWDKSKGRVTVGEGNEIRRGTVSSARCCPGHGKLA